MFFSDLGGIDIKNQNHALNDSSFVGKNMFGERLLSDIDEYVSHQQLESGGSYANPVDGEKPPMKTRSTMIHWMSNEKYKNSLLPIYQQISYLVRKINDGMWGYSYTGYEPFQYSEYKIGDHFDWHIDQIIFTGKTRKVSFSLGLSNKNEYEGGDLVIKSSDQETHYKLDRGDIVVFPSWMLHKVTPITKGKRRVVVGWGEGIIV